MVERTVDLLCLVYHEARNVRHPIKQGLVSTTVLESIIPFPVDDHRSDRAVVAAARGRGVRTPWRWTSAHGVQAAPGVPRGLKPLGRRAGRRKARGSGGENLARSAAR